MSSDLKEPASDIVQVSGQKTLSELLDQIEQRANGQHRLHVIGCEQCAGPDDECEMGVALDTSRALVKALRVAVDSLEIEMLDSPVQAVRTFAKSALQEVGQILREPADSVGQAQRLPYPHPVSSNPF